MFPILIPRKMKKYIMLAVVCYLSVSIVSIIKSSINEAGSQQKIVEEEPKKALQIGGPETFCPSFKKGVGFAERIIFIEASGEECLFARDVCGIESAARANPNMTVDVYIHTGKKFQPKQKATLKRNVRSCAITNLLTDTFPNVRIHREDLLPHLTGSKFQTIVDEGLLSSSAYSLTHFTDALKLVLLRKYGGLYVDTNFLTFRPLHCLNNSMTFTPPEGQQQIQHLSNGVMALDKDHPFLGFATRLLVAKYRPDWKGAMSGVELAEAFRLYCPGSKTFSPARVSCYKSVQIQLVDPKLFYPIERKFIPVLFSSNYRNHLQFNVNVMDNSFMAHIYGSQWGLPVNTKSLYASLAMNYCPLTWQTVQESTELSGF